MHIHKHTHPTMACPDNTNEWMIFLLLSIYSQGCALSFLFLFRAALLLYFNLISPRKSKLLCISQGLPNLRKIIKLVMTTCFQAWDQLYCLTATNTPGPEKIPRHIQRHMGWPGHPSTGPEPFWVFGTVPRYSCAYVEDSVPQLLRT